MSADPRVVAVDARLARARGLIAADQVLSAEIELRAVLRDQPHSVDALVMLADLAARRGDEAQALGLLRQAQQQGPDDLRMLAQLAQAQLRVGELDAGIAALERIVAREPEQFMVWLTLGDAQEHAGRNEQAARARYQAVRHGQKAGYLMNMASTPPAWQGSIGRIIAQVNEASQQSITGGLDYLRRRYGASELERVEHAMAVHMGRLEDRPPSPHQAPKFFYFPGLPPGPYHDPYLHPWTEQLVDAFDDIRDEALQVLVGEQGIEEFLSFQPGQDRSGYLGGDGEQPSWDAFFFHRHGQRYPDNHARCPRTAAVLDAIELCQVDGQAPEICFSVLRPGTHIKPHHGVTNTRLVMHLPLIVPADCALNVFGGGEHAWREREPMMFDDTYLHEAWNRSAQTRVILLMDCWNPHLLPVERQAVRHLVERISAFEDYFKIPPRQE